MFCAPLIENSLPHVGHKCQSITFYQPYSNIWRKTVRRTDETRYLPKMCPTPLLRNKIYHRHPTATGPSLCRTFGAETTTLETLHGNSFFQKCQLPIINTRVSVWPRPKFCANNVLGYNGYLSRPCGPTRHTSTTKFTWSFLLGLGNYERNICNGWITDIWFSPVVWILAAIDRAHDHYKFIWPNTGNGKMRQNKIKQKWNATCTHAKMFTISHANLKKRKRFLLAHDYKIQLFKPQNGKSLTWRDVAMCLGPCCWQGGGDATKLRQIVCFPKRTTYDAIWISFAHFKENDRITSKVN